ncbi:heavy-metal-associated domain-containing protein [Leptolyngbya sp. PCC 6406]|uniref:heavy-metal-associated domain-containing protein n=1 Tax=Leptolyngbya sp. PCC 6406 TaxID=1173264 RepID=UPI0002AC6BF5|nr:heavy-metal-associated domain-containing protein [Leptolyngbya sp. PCC 6406]
MLTLTIPDMACSACADTITQAVQALDPTATVTADPATKQVTIDTAVDSTQVTQAIAAAGYTVQ